MVIATGTSERHIKALCNYVALTLKDKGVVPRGTEGAQGSEWVLMDLGDASNSPVTMANNSSACIQFPLVYLFSFFYSVLSIRLKSNSIYY
jgi:hypothetical protein